MSFMGFHFTSNKGASGASSSKINCPMVAH